LRKSAGPAHEEAGPMIAVAAILTVLSTLAIFGGTLRLGRPAG
jgi:hypothetical protein